MVRCASSPKGFTAAPRFSTTIWLAPTATERESCRHCARTHAPLDLAIIMLGSNDMKPWIHRNPRWRAWGCHGLWASCGTTNICWQGRGTVLASRLDAAHQEYRASPISRIGCATQTPPPRGWPGSIGRSRRKSKVASSMQAPPLKPVRWMAFIWMWKAPELSA